MDDIVWFRYSFDDMQSHSAAFPPYLQVWLNWMTGLQFASFVVLMFNRHNRLLQVVAAAAFANYLMGYPIAATFGPVRLLALGHILFWAPALIFVLHQRNEITWRSVVGVYLALWLVTTSISVPIDAVELFRYLVLGETAFIYPRVL
ncbi:hypothetical protein QMT40_003244 [Parvibaculaceae bacterium PLY_AMNH_Bact1]|nr:hypothetical protein QMT40_003244 [Parvibaculaceae bacterium PLY_AMNH_Bact1]